MKWNLSGTVTDPASPHHADATLEAKQSMTSREKGRYEILAGWLITMTGIVGYIVAMSRAGNNASMLDAFTNQGLLGWGSAALLIGGVGIWFVGNLTALRDLSRMPDGNDE